MHAVYEEDRATRLWLSNDDDDDDDDKEVHDGQKREESRLKNLL